jgi:hypothetical protein
VKIYAKWQEIKRTLDGFKEEKLTAEDAEGERVGSG